MLFHSRIGDLKQMTLSKLIVIWGCENVVNTHIKNSISTRKDWKEVRISELSELDATIQSQAETPEEIVFISEESFHKVSFEDLQVIEGRTDIKLITLSFNNNIMDVFSRQAIFVQQASDLLSIIEKPPYAHPRSPTNGSQVDE